MVNKEWCKNIDEFSTIDVKFNADYPAERHLPRVYSQRIRSCTFASLHVPFQPNFKNPLLVKEITFTTHVSAKNVLKILSVCTNIEALKFLTTMTSETAFENDDETAAVFNNLKHLQFLELGILSFLDRSPKQISRTFSAIIGNDKILFPALKLLSVAFHVRHVEWFQIFMFVSRHSVSLKSLNAICPCGERLIGSEKRSKETMLPSNLTFPQLDSLVVNGASDCSCREDVWLLLDQQKHLKRYETDISRGAVFLKEVIEKNQKTIRVLKLHEIGNLYSDELNCEIFRECLSLQELSLRFDWGFVIVVNVGGGTAQQKMPVLYNLQALPKSLLRLTLCGSQILSHELESLFSVDRGLEEVTLGRADSLKVKNTGMTISILIKMLENMKMLKKFRIFLDMICELESHEVYYCSELNGIWLGIWEIAKITKVINDRSNAETREDTCCGESYNEEACLSHRPYIDLVFKGAAMKADFLRRLKHINAQYIKNSSSTSSSKNGAC